MIYIENHQTDPAYNHAIEEYFLKETKESVFMLWQNVPTILLGKNQDTFQEINLDYTREQGIKVVRRLSGGGTVFCDLGNMQYTFITNRYSEKEENPFLQFARPVVQALRELGLNAEFTGRNDILVDGKKVSGNAQYRYKDRILHHGTILFDVNREMLQGAINTRPIKFSNKTVKSVASRIGTIREWLPELSIHDFMDHIVNTIRSVHNIVESRAATEEEEKRIQTYIPRFNDPVWNLGKDSGALYQTSIKYPFGLVEYKMDIVEGKIAKLDLYGDFFSEQEVDRLAERLIHVPFTKEAMMEAAGEDVAQFIIGMDRETLVSDLLALGNEKEGASDESKEAGLDQTKNTGK